jgi:hypothetical protein
MTTAFSSFLSRVAGYSCYRFAGQRSVAIFAVLLATRLSRPAESTLSTPINNTSSIILHNDPNIISETQHSVNHRKLRFQPCYFIFYLPNKRRRCHLDVARRGRKVYQIYFRRHQPPAFLATPSKATCCSKARKHRNLRTA